MCFLSLKPVNYNNNITQYYSMKVLIANHFPLQGSGSGIYTMNVAREIVNAGHEVLAIVPEHHEVEGYPFPVKAIIFSNGENKNPHLDFNFPCFTTHPRSSTTFYELTDSQVEEYVQAWQQTVEQAITDFQPDVIHAQHIWVTAYVAYRSGLPYIITCHGTDLVGFRKDPRYRDMALAAAKNADAIISVSRRAKAEVAKMYQLSEKKIHLLGNGFDPQCFKVLPDVTREAVLAEFQLGGADKPLISFAGKFTHVKGIDVLLKAAVIYENDLPGVQTVLVGHGELWDEMHALREELNLQGVHFLHHHPQTTVARLYNVADVSVLSSRSEAFPLVAVEALACGTPVVATDVGGLPDCINEEVGKLVPSDDPASLAAALLAELENGTKHTKGVYASQYALENFTWEHLVAQMMKLYQGATGP